MNDSWWNTPPEDSMLEAMQNYTIAWSQFFAEIEESPLGKIIAHHMTKIEGALAEFLGDIEDSRQKDYERSRADLAAKRKELRRSRKKGQWK